jgi:hypothetical protein
MNEHEPITSGIRARLLAALIALGAGVAAAVVAILLLHTVLA